jgi:4-hydroxy-2-oxoheptanedioate aldolase
MVETAKQARALVAATRYPPRGIRGVGAGIARASRWGNIPDYVQNADESVCLLLQIETKTGLENLDEILTVEGIDGIFLGAADLSASLGYLGNPSHPVVLEAMTQAIAKILAADKAPGVLTVEESQAKYFIEKGCLFVAVGVDTLLLSQATRTLCSVFRPESSSGIGGY